MTIAQAETTALVLLNGITRPAKSWHSLRSELRPASMLALDGVGTTSNTTASIPEQARDVLARMDADGIAAADVIGFSHGGLIAQQLAHIAPERVRRLVLLATSCGTGAIAPEFTWSMGPWLRTRDADAHDVSTIAGQLIAISAWSSISFLGSIAAPTLVMHGTHDRLVPVENARILARRIPGARLELLDCGHDLQRPDRVPLVARAINEFLSARPV